MPILTALFPAGLEIVLDRYVRVIGLQAQIPDAPVEYQWLPQIVGITYRMQGMCT